MKRKSLASLKKELDRVFNKFIRQRDSFEDGFVCISCGEHKPLSQLQAGHFWAAGKFTAVRWNEDNCHSQCISCNCFNHGNLYMYAKGLKAKIGTDAFNLLEVRAHDAVKLDRDFLESKISHYKSLI